MMVLSRVSTPLSGLPDTLGIKANVTECFLRGGMRMKSIVSGFKNFVSRLNVELTVKLPFIDVTFVPQNSC